METTVHPVDERLPLGRLTALGLQHVLVMYAGAVAVPLIVGRALNLTPDQVAKLISADLFVCGLVTLIQALGATRWFGIKLPVMMGVTFAAVAPMISMAQTTSGTAGAGLIFGSVIGAGVISILIAPVVSRMLRFFPPVVTGTIIAVIGISLMRVGINWIFGNPVGPTAPSVVNPEHIKWLTEAQSAAGAPGSSLPPVPKGFAVVPTMPNPRYADLTGVGISGLVLLSILLIAKFGKGFIANISVLLGIIIGAVVAVGMGLMSFRKGGQGPVVRPGAALRNCSPGLQPHPDSDHDPGDDRGDDRVHRHVPGPGRNDRPQDRPGRPDPRPAHRWPGHAAGRHLQHLPVHQLLAERGAGGRHGREEPFCLRGRRRDPDRAGRAAQDGRTGGVAARPWCWAAPGWSCSAWWRPRASASWAAWISRPTASTP